MSVEQSIRHKLTQELAPQALVIQNISHEHDGHASSPGTGESHFVVSVVSDRFQGMPKVARFRMVYKILEQEVGGPVHALSLDLKSPLEV